MSIVTIEQNIDLEILVERLAEGLRHAELFDFFDCLLYELDGNGLWTARREYKSLLKKMRVRIDASLEEIQASEEYDRRINKQKKTKGGKRGRSRSV